MKKLLCILLASLMMLALVSCSSHSDEEVTEAAKSLIEASYEINEIYFGKGLPKSDKNVGSYAEVDPTCGYSTVDDLKNAALKVYSAGYCEDVLFINAFEGRSIEGDAESASYARYIAYGEDRLTVRLDAEETGMVLNRTYDFSTITVEKCVRDSATITVQSLVDGAEDEIIKLNLVFENDAWRLDSPTY